MCLAMVAVAFTSCQKNEKPGPDDPEPGDKTALATPTLEATTTDNSFTVTWTAVENAAGYTVKYNNEETPLGADVLKFEKTDLTAGAYQVEVKATAGADNEKYKDSEWATITVEIKSNEEFEDDGTFLGTWEIVCDGYFYITPTEAEVRNEERKITTEIFYDGNITGATGFTEIQYDNGTDVPAYIGQVEDDPSMFGVMSGMQAAAGDDQATPTWLSYCTTDNPSINGTFVLGEYPAYSGKKEGVNATWLPHEGTLSDETTKFKVQGFGIFGAGTDGKSIYLYGDITDYPGGSEWQLTKVANSQMAPKPMSAAAKTISANAVKTNFEVR